MMERTTIQGSPRIKTMRVVPVAGHDSMLLNLSGAHAPFFTRNLVIVSDSSGHIGVGEVPGSEEIRQVLEESRPLVEGRAGCLMPARSERGTAALCEAINRPAVARAMMQRRIFVPDGSSIPSGLVLREEYTKER